MDESVPLAVTNASRLPTKRLRRWVMAFSLLLPFLASAIYLCLVLGYYDVRGRTKWKNYRHHLESLGVRLDLASIVPPPVPEAENFAMAPVFSKIRQKMTNSTTFAESSRSPRQSSDIDFWMPYVPDNDRGRHFE